MTRLIVVLAFGLLTTGTALAEERQARIEVSGLWCPSCSFIVGKSMERSASVEIVEFVPAPSGETGVYTVTYDDTLTSAGEIAAQPSEYGYTAVVLEADASKS